MNDFPPADDAATSLTRIKVAVLGSFEQQAEWPAKVAAGIYAGLDFAIDEPAVIRSLALEESAARPDARRHCAGLVDEFTELLRRTAPREQRHPVSNDRALVHALVAMVVDHVRTGKLDRLSEIAPELVQLTLLPYLGFAEARHWADRHPFSPPAEEE